MLPLYLSDVVVSLRPDGSLHEDILQGPVELAKVLVAAAEVLHEAIVVADAADMPLR